MCDKTEPKRSYEQTVQDGVSALRNHTEETSKQAQYNEKMKPMSQLEKLDELFKFHNPRLDQISKYHAVRSAAKYMGEVILTNTPPGSDQSTAIRKLREAVMTANAAIALDGLNF